MQVKVRIGQTADIQPNIPAALRRLKQPDPPRTSYVQSCKPPRHVNPKDKPIFATYCTPNYWPDALDWKASIEAYGLEAFILEVKNAGTWRANTRQKPAAIKKIRELHPGRAVVYCDSDALLVRYPEIFDGCALGDVGIYFLGEEFLSGTMYWGPSERATELLEAWIAVIDEHKQPICGEQVAFQRVYDERKDRLLVTYLPESYCRIFDNKTQKKDPVILHLMHSRKHDVTEE